MDNQVFNVKGEDAEQLLTALNLAFSVMEQQTAKAFRLHKKKGLILYWKDTSSKDQEVSPFIVPMTPKQLHPQILAFLESDFAREMKLKGWDAPTPDGDISEHAGWRVYTERWGQVSGNSYAFLAITPSSCWYGD